MLKKIEDDRRPLVERRSPKAAAQPNPPSGAYDHAESQQSKPVKSEESPIHSMSPPQTHAAPTHTTAFAAIPAHHSIQSVSGKTNSIIGP